MQNLLKQELCTKTLKTFGSGGSGCISSGQGYDTDNGIVYVKQNADTRAKMMFEGELASLKAILSTETIKCPQPIKVIKNNDDGYLLVMEFVDIRSLNKYSTSLGSQLAQMHLHNINLLDQCEQNKSSIHENDKSSHSAVKEFGFDITTCCGIVPQNNEWTEDWVTFFSRNRIQYQLDMIEQKYGDREIKELWSSLQLKIGNYFKGLDIKPSLIHGDLWSGNAGEDSNGPLIFDAACFYGHHEYDLGIATMFGGFGSTFTNAYHKIIPKAKGFENRLALYQLFHYLNHWNHFGGQYRGSSVRIMKQLLRE